MNDANTNGGDVRAAGYINRTKFTKLLRMSLHECILSRNFFQRYSTKLSQCIDPRFHVSFSDFLLCVTHYILNLKEKCLVIDELFMRIRPKYVNLFTSDF